MAGIAWTPSVNVADSGVNTAQCFATLCTKWTIYPEKLTKIYASSVHMLPVVTCLFECQPCGFSLLQCQGEVGVPQVFTCSQICLANVYLTGDPMLNELWCSVKRLDVFEGLGVATKTLTLTSSACPVDMLVASLSRSTTLSGRICCGRQC